MFNAKKVDVWAVTVEDRPGGVRDKLEAIAKVGANLEFVLARRTHEEPGKGALFVTAMGNARQQEAAVQAGFRKTTSLHAVRLEGPDEPGIAYLVTHALAAEGVNLRSVSAMTLGGQFVMYLAFDTEAEADHALTRLERAL
jgi:hypothetical protein